MKFKFSKKASKFDLIFHLDSNFVALLENLKFIRISKLDS